MIDKVISEKGVDIKSTDNKYHISVKTGQTSCSKKYSNECIELLRKVMNGEEYDI